MNRELRLTRPFVDLADTLPESFDPLDLFARLGGHCTELPAVDAVGVVMADSRGALRNMVASDDDLLLLHLFQVQQEEGPSVDCFRTGEVVAADDLREGARWPRYTAQALEAGYVSVHVLPLRLEGRPIGAVSLLKREADALPTEDLAVAQGMSDVAALTLTHWPPRPAARTTCSPRSRPRSPRRRAWSWPRGCSRSTRASPSARPWNCCAGTRSSKAAP